MAKPIVLITDHRFPDVEIERRLIEAAGATLVVSQCATPAELLEAARDVDAMLVQAAPVTSEVIAGLKRCRIMVRYGTGVDNVDLAAAAARGIPVCNVPDYGTDEVADHAVALALSLARQLPQIDRRTRRGVWDVSPDAPMPAFREMTFATAGFGRIARAVQARVEPFGFRRVTSDPFVSDDDLVRAGVIRLPVDDLFREADIFSVHLPLSAQTRHFVNADRLRQMKPTAVLVNTARGGLIDTVALAEALKGKVIASAGLDVFEEEPLPADHPLRQCDNALLTSHVAWYSESSFPKLRGMAAKEIVRGLRGESLRNKVN